VESARLRWAWATADFARSAYPNGVCFVDLGSVPSPRLIFGRLAAALGLNTVASDPLPYIMQFLQAHRMLIVLGQLRARQSTPAALLAEKLLTGSAAVCILATSREPLRVKDESVLRLAPLELPPPAVETTAAEALRYPAIQLFRRACGGLSASLSSTHSYTDIVDICRKLDGLRWDPSWRRAGGCLRDPRPRRVFERSARLPHPGVIARPYRAIGPCAPHSTWSYELLPASEQTALRRLSVLQTF